MPDGDHLLIGLHHPRGAAMTRFKREANLQGWDGCSTRHDGLLAAVTSASQEAAPSGVGPQKPVTIARLKLCPWNTRRELYQKVSNFVGSVTMPPCGVPLRVAFVVP